MRKVYTLKIVLILVNRVFQKMAMTETSGKWDRRDGNKIVKPNYTDFGQTILAVIKRDPIEC